MRGGWRYWLLVRLQVIFFVLYLLQLTCYLIVFFWIIYLFGFWMLNSELYLWYLCCYTLVWILKIKIDIRIQFLELFVEMCMAWFTIICYSAKSTTKIWPHWRWKHIIIKRKNTIKPESWIDRTSSSQITKDNFGTKIIWLIQTPNFFLFWQTWYIPVLTTKLIDIF